MTLVDQMAFNCAENLFLFSGPASDRERVYRNSMRVLVAFDRCGAIRAAFNAIGHDALSVYPGHDLSMSLEGAHLDADPLEALEHDSEFDLVVARLPAKLPDSYLPRLLAVRVPRIAVVETPGGNWRNRTSIPASQYLWPADWGHADDKNLALWTRGLSDIGPGTIGSVHPRLPAMNDTFLFPSRIAASMAVQWSYHIAPDLDAIQF